jgi:hypothetical protein
MSEKPTPELIDLLGRLDRSGKAPSKGRLGDLVKQDRRVREFGQRALENQTRSDWPYLEGTALMLRDVDPAVIRCRLGDVLSACLRARHPLLGALVLTELKSPLPKLLVERWAQTLGTRDLVADGLWCAHCLSYEPLPDRRRDQLEDAVRGYARTLPQDKLDAWVGDVAHQAEQAGAAGAALRNEWEAIFAAEAHQPRLSQRLSPRVSLWRNRDGGQP